MTPIERKFSVTQDHQPLYGWGPSATWTYTDKAKHVHRYEDRYEPLLGTCYPTLTRKTEHVPCGDPECCCGGYCEGYETSWYVCSACGEVIHPGQEQKTYYQLGRINYAVDGVQVTETEYKRQLAELGYDTKGKELPR